MFCARKALPGTRDPAEKSAAAFKAAADDEFDDRVRREIAAWSYVGIVSASSKFGCAAWSDYAGQPTGCVRSAAHRNLPIRKQTKSVTYHW
ncbi:MAG: hypothetical protein K8R36_16110 [Planctomycetales bacterium]|nr:hypothetical protein [Planctomycetales bacterium]